MSFDPNPPPAAKRHQRPDSFHCAKGPCALQKAINRTQSAGKSEGKNEPWAAIFERVEDQHRGNSKKSESGERVQCGPFNGNAIVKQSSCKERPHWWRLGIFEQKMQSTANYSARLSMNTRSTSRTTPVPPRESPTLESGGPSPRDGSVLRTRSELPSRDRAPAGSMNACLTSRVNESGKPAKGRSSDSGREN